MDLRVANIDRFSNPAIKDNIFRFLKPSVISTDTGACKAFSTFAGSSTDSMPSLEAISNASSSVSFILLFSIFIY